MRHPLAVVCAVALGLLTLVAQPAYAGLARGRVATTASGSPVAPDNVILPEVVGLDTVGSTLAARTGTWTGSPTPTYTCSWHMIGGASLGTNCASFGPLVSGQVGSRLQVDVTATNTAGSQTQTSYFVGPVETALPTLTLGVPVAPTALPVYPANFIENGYPIYPGCTVPDPSVPIGRPTHEWYFDPINGHTLAQGATGHLGDPFNNQQALFGGIQGYGSLSTVTSVSAPSGGNVTIKGVGFGIVQGGGQIYIGGVQVTHYVSWGNTGSIVTIPSGAPPNPTISDVEVDTALFFGDPVGYGAPVSITGVTTPTGSTFAVTGSGFGDGRGGAGMLIGGVPVTNFTVWSNTSITGGIPAGAPTPTTGNIAISVATATTGILAGDVAYIKGDPSGATIGTLDTAFSQSTSDGTTSGTPVFTWVVADPTSVVPPVLTDINLSASAGFLVDGLHVEGNALQTSTFAALGKSMVTVQGGIGSPGNGLGPAHDIIFQNMSLTSWSGHSNDPWNPSSYPKTGGHSDGTILTASPYMGPGTADPQVVNVTAASGATQVFLNNSVPAFTAADNPANPNNPNIYVWSPGYYNQAADPAGTSAPSNTGIPNGTIVKDVQGRTDLINEGTVATSASLPATVVLNQDYLALDTKHLWIGCQEPTVSLCPTGTSLVWADAGAAYMTIAACDPVANAASGCPSTNYPGLSTNIPQCDPLIIGNASPGGCVGAPAAWSGTTRALSAEYLTFTPHMVEAPSGWWSHIDWDYTLNGFNLLGAMGSGSPDPTNPNDPEGAYCLSLKNNMVRYIWNGIGNELVTHVAEINNKVKYRAGDSGKLYSSHQVIAAYNYFGEASFIKEHQDMFQPAMDNGTQLSEYYYNALVDNEGNTYTDPDDIFANYTQSFDNTDSIYSGTYVANNILINSLNNLFFGGFFNVLAHNDTFMDINSGAAGIQVLSAPKTPADRNLPTNDLLANNITNRINRNLAVPGAPTDCTADQNTVEGNVTIPAINFTADTVAIGNSTNCRALGNTGIGNGNTAGVYPDMVSWSAQDWRSGQGGVTPLFMGFNPTTPVPTPPASGLGVSAPTICVANEIKTGTCSSGVTSVENMRPNASFPATVLTQFQGNVTNINSLPTTGSVGDQYILGAASACGSGFAICGSGTGPNTCATAGKFFGCTFPAGLYTRINSNTDMTGYGSTPATSFASNVAPFTPGIIGTGTNLSAQAPPTNHARQPWSNPPNVGAY